MIVSTLESIVGVVLGAGMLAALLGSGVWILMRHARRAGVLAPVLWGLGIRLGAMLVVHGSSLLAGESGLMFLDDKTYLWKGTAIASAWRAGDVINPGSYDYAGTPMFGYQALLGVAFLLVGDIIAGKLVNVLASTGTVLCTALIAGKIWGDEARRRAAWLAALLPGLVWWSTPMMKEAVAGFLLAACLLALLNLGRPWALAWFVLALGALALTRTAAAAALLLAAAPVAGWLVVRNRHDFDVRRLLGGAFAAICLAGVPLLIFSRGDVVGLVQSYTFMIDSMIAAYRESGPLHVPVSIAQSFISPYPWVFDAGTRNWDMGLYPGMWMWYALYPLAGLAVLRYRRRPEVVLLVLIVAIYLALNAFTSGFVFRQRSTIEPIIVLLAIGGLTSWRMGAMVAAGTWAFVALPAAAQSGNPLTVLAILVGSGCAALLARRLPADAMNIQGRHAILPALRGAAQKRWAPARPLMWLALMVIAVPLRRDTSREPRQVPFALRVGLSRLVSAAPDAAERAGAEEVAKR
jgi:hypothetical protein